MTCRAPAVVAVLSLLSVGCSTPLSVRRAQVLNRGQAEVMVSPQFQVGVLADNLGQISTPFFESGGRLSGGRVFGWGEVSARFGVAERMDLQLRVDPSLLPEVALGYQFLGETGVSATRSGTVTVGLKVGAPALFGSAYEHTLVGIPVQLLYDLPLGEHAVLVTGLRVIPSITRDYVSVAPGAVAAVSFGGTGPWRFQPEVAVSANFMGLGKTQVDVAPSFTFGANFGYVFGAGE
ncbi:MAG: hypothetical protein RL653_4086 [Pseudomonadota bacterium]|jgi:hypothetical protein